MDADWTGPSDGQGLVPKGRRGRDLHHVASCCYGGFVEIIEEDESGAK
jgi:hypothetical protein